ncbi:WGR domain-containing protein [uncultured Umboniibacter sp.]|uniref:WGR domain-containing protein n=1 Tax=uncultured Umboniibacter sp. TaxID=1798917 RepID=UPI00261D2D6E|nr:WGR domain-containing protein [uncultured Umboniibacter sp.]
MLQSEVVKSAHLVFSQGGSDKEYKANIEAVSEGYLVNFSYGRRGSALKSGSKTTNPVTLEAAEKTFAKLIKSKSSKGYTILDAEGADEVISVLTIKDESGVQCQLLNEISESEATVLCADNHYVAQEKHDGERRLLALSNGEVKGINRKGFYVPVNPSLATAALASFPMDSVIDGELIGEDFHAFDVLNVHGVDVTGLGFGERYKMLCNETTESSLIAVSLAAATATSKMSLLNAIKNSDGEGLVFKNIHAPYVAGRPNSGGSQLKLKFWSECSVKVSGIHATKRSVSLQLSDNATWVDVGNVTIPANASIPAVGSIIEVRYLYAYQGGSLYQPIFEKPRFDQDFSDCLMSQLKYKA